MGACKDLKVTNKEFHQKCKKQILKLVLCNDISCTTHRDTRFLQIYEIFSKRHRMIQII